MATLCKCKSKTSSLYINVKNSRDIYPQEILMEICTIEIVEMNRDNKIVSVNVYLVRFNTKNLCPTSQIT